MQLLSSRVVAPGRFKGNGMLNGKRIAVVLPAYNAEKTLEATVRELPDLVDIRILVDDHSSDRTVEVAHQLGLQFYVHDQNYGYGRNQQTCYREALAEGADVVIMLHPDYQYTPLLVTAMASMVAFDVYDVVLGFRIGEVSCPTKYFEEGSSINFRRSVTYGLGVLGTTLQFALQKMGVARFRLFSAKGRRLEPGYVTYYARGAIGAAQK